MKKSFVVLIGIFLAFPGATLFAGTDCVSTVTSDMNIHVPVLGFGFDLYSLDLQYIPSSDGNIWFSISGIGPADMLVCDNASWLDDISGSMQIHVPALALGAANYWATLEYVPETGITQAHIAAASGAMMRLNAFGNSGDDALAPLVPYPSNLHFFSAFQGEITGPDVAIYFQSWKYNVAVSSDQPLGSPEITGTGALYFPGNESALQVSSITCDAVPVPTFLSNCSCTGSIPADQPAPVLRVGDMGIGNPGSSNPQIRLHYLVQPFDMRFDIHCTLPDGRTPFDWGGVFSFPYLSTHQGDTVASGEYMIDTDQWGFYRDPQWRQVVYAYKNYFDATGTMRQGSEQSGIHTVNVTEVGTGFTLEMQ